ncbi:hypothetical protein FXO37_25262 [Capsicum annuum]|nr:hypothetical protein FXO37_25262 [Capsicum annuum]
MFDTKFSGMVPFMNETWFDNFEVIFEETKATVVESEANLSNFEPLYHASNIEFCSHHCYYSGSSKRYKINWALWFREYILESVADTHALGSFSYGLLITQTLHFYSIDLSGFPTIEVSATYDSKTFASMGYALVGSEQGKKDFVEVGYKPPKVTKSVANPISAVLKDMEEVK